MIAVSGRLDALSPRELERLYARSRATAADVERIVAGIVADVEDRGDAALRELAARFDPAVPDRLEVPASALERALERIDPAVRTALEQAADAISTFHRAQLPPPLEVEIRPGVRLGRRAEPLRRVGVYAPGGRAAYPSSVLMGVVPARVAGVDEVAVCSPPGPDGRPPAAVLAACAIGGADRVFSVGGAGAIAALAYGTASVPPVQKIVGPGNAYVNEAKRQLTGIVGIDTPAGPSELLIIADETADARLAAIELVAQAEHDPDASVALITTDAAFLAAVRAELETLIPQSPRSDIVATAFLRNGALLAAASMADAVEFAERYAPEHLLLMVREPRAVLARIRAAGTVFLGERSSVAFGDYLTGANHVLPTGGLARIYSGLSTFEFLRWTTYQEVGAAGARALAGPTATLAEAEGLPGHAAAARARAGRADAAAPTPGSAAADAHGERRAAPAEAGAGSSTSGLPFRRAYRELDVYDPGRRPIELDLSDNTSRFGPSPAAARALADADAEALSRYPEVYADRLREALAESHGVGPDNIVTGCGSDDVLDSAVRAFCDTGDVVAYAEPTFGMVPIVARMNAARAVGVPLADGFALDPNALLAARGRVTYLCRPNNPTGTLFDRAAVERLAREATGIVFLDEAYADFAGESMVRWAAGSERTIVFRTFSKAHGLAGLRVGYAVGPARLVREIRKSRGPYKVAAVAEAAALAALTRDRAWHRRVVRETRDHRDRLAHELRGMGLRVWPSAANFLLFAAPDRLAAGAERDAATRLGTELRRRGIAVRVFPGLPHAGDGVRVSIGPWPLMERFLVALAEVIGTAGVEGDA